MRTLTIFIWLAAASLLQAATVNWTEFDANGLQIANGTFATVCASFLSVGSACSEPSSFSATTTHSQPHRFRFGFKYRWPQHPAGRNRNGNFHRWYAGQRESDLGRTLFSRSCLPFQPRQSHSRGGLVSDDRGLCVIQPRCQRHHCCQQESGHGLRLRLLQSIDGQCGRWPIVFSWPDTRKYASNFGNGLFTHLSVTFNFLGATVVAGDSMDIPVSSTSSPVPETATVWLACGALGVLAVRRWRTSNNGVPAGPRG